MRSGLYWGTVGAVNELVARLSSDMKTAPRIVVSGGTAELLKDRLLDKGMPRACCHVHHLVLSGIASIACARNAIGTISQ